MDMPLSQIGRPELVFRDMGSEQLPGLQMLVYDSVDGGYKYIAKESNHHEYGDNWWSRDVFGDLPGKENTYRNFFGSLDDLYNYNPEMVVIAVGYSLGSGAKGDVIIESMTFGNAKYLFSSNRAFDIVISYKANMDEIDTQTLFGLEEGSILTTSNLELPVGYGLASPIFNHIVRGPSTLVVDVKAAMYNLTINYTYNSSVIGRQTIDDILYGRIISASELNMPEGYYCGDFSPIMVTEDAAISVPVFVYDEYDNDEALNIEPETPPLGIIEFTGPYLSGYPDGTIKPEGNLSRAETSQILMNLLGIKAYTAKAPVDLTDVDESSWAYNSVNFAVKENLMVGYPNGSFGVDKNTTRAEFVTILARIKNLESAEESNFHDINGHWAQKYIQPMEAMGILSGYGNGSFLPDRYITRAESTVIINKLLGRSQSFIVNNEYADLSEDFWAYPFIMNAASGIH